MLIVTSVDVYEVEGTLEKIFNDDVMVEPIIRNDKIISIQIRTPQGKKFQLKADVYSNLELLELTTSDGEPL